MRRGEYFERYVGMELERWLDARPGTFHLFHDLTGFRNVSGYGLGPMSLGVGNIDHLVVTAAGYLLLDSKGVGVGTLTVDDHGKGVLVQADGTIKPQPWMDKRKAWTYKGIMARVTGMGTAPASTWCLTTLR